MGQFNENKHVCISFGWLTNCYNVTHSINIEHKRPLFEKLRLFANYKKVNITRKYQRNICLEIGLIGRKENFLLCLFSLNVPNALFAKYKGFSLWTMQRGCVKAFYGVSCERSMVINHNPSLILRLGGRCPQKKPQVLFQ